MLCVAYVGQRQALSYFWRFGDVKVRRRGEAECGDGWGVVEGFGTWTVEELV